MKSTKTSLARLSSIIFFSEPALVTSKHRSQILGYFFLVGGLISLLVSFLGHLGTGSSSLPLTVIGGISLAVGLVLIRWDASINLVFSLLFLGTALVTAVIYFQGSAPMALASLLAYVFIIVCAAYFFPWREAYIQLAFLLTSAFWVLDHFNAGSNANPLILFFFLTIFVIVAWMVRLGDLAEKDVLTCLPNRRAYNRIIEEMLDSDRSGLGLTAMDFDGFKDINDQKGHAEGDVLLAKMGHSWNSAAHGEEDFQLFRLGGDEFILLSMGKGLEQIREVVNQLVKAMAAEGVGISAGVALHNPAESLSEFEGRADVALYEAKASGRGRIVVFGEAESLAQDLLNAMEEGQLELHLQPIMHGGSRQLASVECLLRWNHPERGFVHPSSFIPRLEAADLVHRLGEWTINRAVAIAGELRPIFPELVVGYNVSTVELANPHYYLKVKAALEASNVDPHHLLIEMTETAMESSPTIIRKNLEALHELGVLIAIDDFGSGFTNLLRMDTIPFDLLKLDRSLLDGVVGGKANSPMVEAIINLAHCYSAATVASGIEDDELATKVESLGIDMLQGYHLGRPSTVEEFIGQFGPDPMPTEFCVSEASETSF